MPQLTDFRVFLKKTNSPKKLDVCDGEAQFQIKRTEHYYLLNVETGQIHGVKSQLLQKLNKGIASEMGLS